MNIEKVKKLIKDIKNLENLIDNDKYDEVETIIQDINLVLKTTTKKSECYYDPKDFSSYIRTLKSLGMTDQDIQDLRDKAKKQ